MIWVGEKGLNIYSTWTMSADERKKLENYYKKFEEYVTSRRNVIYNRYKFHSRVQSESETFDQFSTDLKMMVKDCKYAESDNMVRDRIVIGIRSHKIREKLINVGSELTLVKATEIARLHELSSVQAKTMSGEDVAVNEIRKKNRGSMSTRKTFSDKKHAGTERERSKASDTTSTSKCSRCGYSHAKTA